MIINMFQSFLYHLINRRMILVYLMLQPLLSMCIEYKDNYKDDYKDDYNYI